MVKGYHLALTKELHALGFRHTINAKGGHEKWVRGNEILIVPQHLLSKFLANDLLKMAGSKKRF